MRAPDRTGRTPGIGEDLALLARIRAIPATEVARRAGIDYTRASRIMRGRRPPTPDEVRALALAIALDPEDAA
jgi:transcriptional regulator with XRE-family HTH domain